MSRVEVRRRGEHRTMPWRNGGGITHELACAPAGSADFDWRVSIAEIETAGPFSAFPGVDRIITLIDGPWLDLVVDGTRRRLRPLEPFAFDGGAETSCEIPSRTVDLNVMCRAGRTTAATRIVRVDRAAVVDAAEPSLVICLEGSVAVEDAVLEPWDLATVAGGPAGLRGRGVVAAVDLRPTGK